MHRLQHLHIVQRQRRAHALHPRTRPSARNGGAAGIPNVSSHGTSDAKVLVVGGGPSGLECARALGQRGYQVKLAEARNELGGRVPREAALPGLAEWNRVRDWRLGQLHQLANVETYPASRLDVDRHFGVRLRQGGYRDGIALAQGRQRPLDISGHRRRRPGPRVDTRRHHGWRPARGTSPESSTMTTTSWEA